MCPERRMRELKGARPSGDPGKCISVSKVWDRCCERAVCFLAEVGNPLRGCCEVMGYCPVALISLGPSPVSVTPVCQKGATETIGAVAQRI